MSYQKLSTDQIRLHKGKSFVGITTTAICHDGNGKYFLNKRGESARDERGVWDLCGGGLEVGLTAEENCINEVEEEYGTTPLEVVPLGTRELFRTDHDGNPTHWLSIDFLVKIDPKEARRNEPHKADAVGWFALGEFPKPWHSQMATILDTYKGVLR